MTGIALVTGSAVRVGREISLHLAEKGWDLALHYNSSSDEAKVLEADLKFMYPHQKFETFRANLATVEETQNLIGEVIAHFGHLNLLINNAAIFDPASFKDTSVHLLDKTWAINFRAPFILMNEYAHKADQGLIINMTDSRITNNKTNYFAYSVAKKALQDLTKMAALELAPAFRVNSIAPGALLPPAGKGEGYLERIAAKMPMGIPVRMENIMQSIDYLIENDNMTGQLLFCDSGESLVNPIY
jgi:NAD(P)-dependent dehydrogenase (short-subunit alcohol dehydrogenase family)